MDTAGVTAITVVHRRQRIRYRVPRGAVLGERAPRELSATVVEQT